MKKIVVLLFLTFLLTGCGKNKDELVMVTEAGFAPYEYYENGEIVGVDIDIAKEIAKELGKKLVVKDIAFDSIISEVKTGKSDFGMAGISYTEERSKQVDFSINYSESKQVVIVKDNSPLTMNDIKNKRVAVQLGSLADTFITDEYPKATLVREKKYLAAVQDLKDGKADCVAMDELPAKYIISNNKGLKLLDGYLLIDSYGAVVKKGNKELLDTINSVIERLQNEGKIDEFILNHTSGE